MEIFRWIMGGVAGLLVLGWKVLIPIGLVWAMATAVIVVARDTWSWGGWLAGGITLFFTGVVLWAVNHVIVTQQLPSGLALEDTTARDAKWIAAGDLSQPRVMPEEVDA